MKLVSTGPETRLAAGNYFSCSRTTFPSMVDAIIFFLSITCTLRLRWYPHFKLSYAEAWSATSRSIRKNSIVKNILERAAGRRPSLGL